MGKLLWSFFCAGGIVLGCISPTSAEGQSPNVKKCVDEATKKLVIAEHGLLKTNPLRDSDVPEALVYIKKHSDYTSHVLLMALRKYYPASYKKVSTEDKVAILCSTLESIMAMNDFFEALDPDEPLDPLVNGKSGKALLETGKVALKKLLPILDNDRPALVFGSEEATTSQLDRYRRKDFAYRFVSLILGKTPVFRRDPKERDKYIDALKAELKNGTR